MPTVPARSVATPQTSPSVATRDLVPTRFEAVGADGFRALVSDWDGLCASRPDNPFAQSPAFVHTLWLAERAPRRDLVIATGRAADGQLCALLPMVRERSRLPILGLDTLRPLALHCQETSALARATDSVVLAQRMADYLLGADGPACDVVHFESIAVGGELHVALHDAAARLDQPVLSRGLEANPLIRPRGGELPGPSARFRRNVRRAWRLARESGRQVECREISWDWQSWRDSVARIYRARWGESPVGSSYALHDPQRLDLVDALLSRLDRFFRTHAFGCFVDGELTAYVICVRGGSEVVLWSTCMDADYRSLNVGMLLWDSCLHTLAGWPGIERINFGKGGDRYKLDWSDDSYPVADLAIVRARGLKRRRALARWPAAETTAVDV
jgi:CelD/BcsL family acetyltransferase involved in cellulose biosynthesis